MVDRNQPPRRIDEPAPCFIRMQLVRNGVFVAARIFYRLGMLCGEINGKDAPVEQVWVSGELITEAEFNDMMENPPTDPYRVVHISTAGLADRIREAEEMDARWWRDFA